MPCPSLIVNEMAALRPCKLFSQIKATYEQACSAGAAASIAHRTATHWDDELSVNYVLKVAAKLRDKPGTFSHPTSVKQDRHNPFLPYDESLWVAHLSNRHLLLLNKFNLVEYHSLIVTRAFESQDDPLNADDLDAAWTVLQAYPDGALAFFNHGPCSGASQPHKHLQVVPLPINGPSEPAIPFGPIVEDALATSTSCIVEVRRFPFKAFAIDLMQRECGTTLQKHCNALMSAAGIPLESSNVSYNWLMTKGWMLVVPRRAESYQGTSANSLGYAGTFFLRSQEEIDIIQSVGPTHVLTELACPW